ncbi:hypothetical protein AADG07_005685, partial [Escherichia coli]
MRVKTMGASPLSGRIFQGTLNTEKGMWVGKREDVTDQAVRAVAEHMMHGWFLRIGLLILNQHQISGYRN